MIKKILFLSLVVVWTLGVVFAYFIGQNVGARKVQQQIQEQRRKMKSRHPDRGRFGPGDDDPRGNGP